jgi:hypothetical protein
MKRCFSCDIELPAAVLIVAGLPYCCSGCSVGGPCCCTYEGQSVHRPTNGHADPLVTGELLGFFTDRATDERSGQWQ